MTNPYIEALSKIPKGETRSFAEIAALAGRPSAARAAGRAVASCPSDAKTPWHRAVNTEGAFSIDSGRAALQLVRLRAERARPKEGESVTKWSRRVHAAFVGTWRGRRFVAVDDERAAAFAPERVERFASAEEALARGFRPFEAARTVGFDDDTGSTRKDAARSVAARPGAARKTTTPQDESTQDDRLRRKQRPRIDRTPVARGSARRVQRARTAVIDEDDAPARRPIEARLAGFADFADFADFDWNAARQRLRDEGAFVAPGILSPEECAHLRGLFADDELFERTIEMAPRGYGIGRYRYWREPLPSPAFELRDRLYRELSRLAAETPGAVEYPRGLKGFFERCRRHGQRRSSSILLWYPRGGVNHAHRDIYGAQWFPYQAVVVLSRRHVDFEGGEFLLHEKRPDGSTRLRELPLDQGDLCVFASRSYVSSAAGKRRTVELEHGMGTVTRGERFALGIVMHLAE